MNKKYYRSYINKLIGINPTDITIQGFKETDDGFGGTLIEETEIQTTTIFYERKARREVVSEYGKSYKDIPVTKLLLTHDIDIYEKDIVKCDNREYRVVLVKNYLDICKQVELDVIS